MRQRLKNIIKTIVPKFIYSAITSFSLCDQHSNLMRLEKRAKDIYGSDAVIDLVFVHGLGGDLIDTWKSGKDSDAFWPDWLSGESGLIQIWTLGWPTKKFSWGSSDEMTIQDRANSVLELLCNHEIGDRKLIFICHSLGGILVKELLRSSDTLNNPVWKKISANTVGVVFMGTPHTGSSLANVLKLVPGTSMKVAELSRNDGILRNLNHWYRAYASESGTKTLTLFETKPVPDLNLLVVDQSSADPGVADSIPVAAEANHYNICKPFSKIDPIYLAVSCFLNNQAGPPPSSKAKSHVTGKVDAFRESYLISETGCLPFGGRVAEITLLNDWLADAVGPGRLLITGPTGRGKSALLVRWSEMIAHTPTDNAWRIVFVPISMRFGTNRPSVFYSILATQLAEILDSPLQSPAVDPEGFYSGVISSMLRELASKTTRVLIVVDGIDEALDQQFATTIFPLFLPPTIKIVLSAREQANDAGSMGWKRRIGWDTDVRVSSIELSTLKKSGVRDVLESVGFSLDEIDDGVVDCVMHLSDGEPLLVKLYAEDLLAMAKSKGLVNVKDLEGLRPGYGPYFSRWIEFQRQAWKDEGSVINDRMIDGTLAVLACAFGPLQTEHLLPLVCKISGQPQPLSIDHLVRPLKRFITGCGTIDSGYVLNHPKLGQYLCEEYFDGAAILKTHQEFVNWGRITVDAIKNEDRISIEVPPYLLQYYTQHLATIRGTIDDYASLLNNGWRLAWEKFEGGFRGYSTDIKSVLSRLGATEQYLPDVSNSLRLRVRAALCLSSVQSIGNNCPIQLLALALDERLLTVRQATHYVDMQLPANRISSFVVIFKHLTEDQKDEVIHAIYKIEDVGNRAGLLVKIFEELPLSLRDRVLIDILDLISKIDNPLQRAGLMLDLVPYLGVDHLSSTFSQIISIPITPDNTTSCSIYFGKLSKCFEKAGDSLKAADALHRSLVLLGGTLDGSDDDFGKVGALSELAHILPEDTVQFYVDLWYPQVNERKNKLISRVRAGESQFGLDNELVNAYSLQATLMFLSAQRHNDLDYEKKIDEIFIFFDAVDTWWKLHILTDHLKHIRRESKKRIIEICFKLALQLSSGNNRTHALMSLAKDAVNPLKAEIVREGLINSQLIEDAYPRGLALVALFSQLSAEDKLIELPKLMEEINEIDYVLHRGIVVNKLATHLPELSPQLFELGVSLISMASNDMFRFGELINVIEKLPSSQRITVFRQCLEYLLRGTDPFTGMKIAFLIKKTTDLCGIDELEAAFRFSDKTTQHDKIYLLSALVPLAVRFGRRDIVDVAFIEILAQQVKNEKIGYLLEISPYMSSAEERDKFINDALEAASDIHVSADRATALIRLLPVLSGEQREEIWHLAKNAILDVDDNWRLLKNLSDYCLEADEKNRLVQASFATAAKLPPTTLVPAVGELAPILGSISEQLRALDLITNQAGVSRSTFLLAVEQSASVFANVGGATLVRQLMHDITENAQVWQ